ncbi:MAG: DUF5671 domain-containing protein [Actinomycetota bacterium]
MPVSGAQKTFYFLLTLFTLYLSSAGLMMLTWGLAEVWFPDPLHFSSGKDLIRTGISMVVVSVPAYSYLSAQARKFVFQPDAERTLFQKALIYLTLLVVALSAIAAVIALVYLFLGGELTGRFAVRGLGVLLTVGLVYLYYVLDLRPPKAVPAEDAAA